jgi:hypothetical protein
VGNDAGVSRKPWYRRRVNPKYRVWMAVPWVPGIALAFWASSITLRLIGLVLVWAGGAVFVYGLMHSDDR